MVGTPSCAAHRTGVPQRRVVHAERTGSRSRPGPRPAACSSGARSSTTPERLQHVGGTAGRRRRPVAVLDHPGAGGGRDDRRHRGDVHRVGRSPPEPTTSTACSAISIGVANSSMVSASADSSSTVSPLAAQGDDEGGQLRRRRRTGQDLAIAQAERRAVSGPRPDQDQLGQPSLGQAVTGGQRCVVRAARPGPQQVGRRPPAAGPGRPGARRHRRPATRSPARRRRRRPVSTRIGGQSMDLVLELPAQAHAAGHGLTVQDGQVDAAARPWR